jgi:hypothetical protein
MEKLQFHRIKILHTSVSVLNAFCIEVLGCLLSEKTKPFDRKCHLYNKIALSCPDLPVRHSLPKTHN